MNQMKRIFGKTIARPSSHVALSYFGQHTSNLCKNLQFTYGSALSRSNPFVTRKNHTVKCWEQFRQDSLRFGSNGRRTIFKQRSRTKSSITSLRKKSSKTILYIDKTLKNAACCYSTLHQSTKFSLASKRYASQIVAMRNIAKNVARINTSMASVEQQSRSYAEIIADYSKALESAQNGNGKLYFKDVVRKNLFAISSNEKPASERDETAVEANRSPHALDDLYSTHRQHADRSAGDVTDCENLQHYDTISVNKAVDKRKQCVSTANCVDSKSENQSYAKADAGKFAKSTPLARKPGLIPSKNVLDRSSLELFGTPTRKASSTNTRETQQNASIAAIPPFGSAIKEQTNSCSLSKENDWLREIESVISDLRSASDRKTIRVASVSRLRESSYVLREVVDGGSTLDRIQKLAELIKAHKQKARNTLERSEANSHVGNSTTKSTTSRKNVTQIGGTAGGALKQPQVQLHMVPSAKESVVSINVDSAGLAGQDPASSAAKQLSVVVQSDRKEERWGSVKGASQRGNEFGPMRISISEDSAPVKQIEFSINGKPVSELKSITARTGRLDVVSSADKIEIRIPFAKDDASTKMHTSNLARQAELHGGQVLNVHIAANFQTQPGKGGDERPMETVSSHIPKTRFTLNKPIRADTGGRHVSSTRFDNAISGNPRVTTISATSSKRLPADETIDDVSLMERAATDSSKVEEWNAKKSIAGVYPQTNKSDKNESADSRVPSKVIPWWSSSDSFYKIRKNDERQSLASNRNEKKIISSLNQEPASAASKSRETSSSADSQTNDNSPDNAAANNVFVSFADASKVEQRNETSKPCDRYSHPFRLKLNDKNLNNPKPDSKTEAGQTSDTEKTDKNLGETRQAKFASSALNSPTTNEQTKRNASGTRTEKISVSPKNERNASAKNEERYPLKRVSSSEDASSMKLNIGNIIDAIKPIEKRKDGTLIDYGLKVPSRKPMVKLNPESVEKDPKLMIKKRKSLLDRGHKETQRDVKQEKNTPKTILNRQEIDRNISAKQAEVDEMKKEEITTSALKKREDLTVKNTAHVKERDRSEMSYTRNTHDNGATSLNFPSFKDTLKFPAQTSKKHEKLANDSARDNSAPILKSPESNRSAPSVRNSSVMKSKSKQQSETSSIAKTEEAVKLTSNLFPRNSNINELEKLKNLAQSKDNSSKEFSDKKIVQPPSKSNANTRLADTKASPTSKIAQTSGQSMDSTNKNATMPDAKSDMIKDAKFATQNSKVRNSLANERKTKSSRRDSAESDNSKTDNKPFVPKMCAAPTEQSQEFRPEPHQAVPPLEISQNLSNVGDMSEPSLVENAAVEKNDYYSTYSTWMQLSHNCYINNDNNEKFF